MAAFKFWRTGLTILWIYMILLCTLSCDDSVVPSNDSLLSGQERALVRTWRYETVKIIHDQKGLLLDSLDNNFEIYPEGQEYLPEELDITRRRIIYHPDHSYDLQWDRESYFVLGTDQNWQPQFGFWKFDSNDSLIHNPTFPYEVKYKINTLNDTLFIRQSNRVMSTTKDSIIWDIGDTVLFIETFVPAD